MWNKIYAASLVGASIVMILLSYFAYDWLHSIGSPRTALGQYAFYSAASWTFLWVSAAALLAIANVILWSFRSAWAMWATLAYFIVFLALRLFWLDRAAASFLTENRLSDGGPAIGGFFAAVLAILAAAIVYFNQFLVLRMNERMYAAPGGDLSAAASIDETRPQAELDRNDEEKGRAGSDEAL